MAAPRNLWVVTGLLRLSSRLRRLMRTVTSFVITCMPVESVTHRQGFPAVVTGKVPHRPIIRNCARPIWPNDLLLDDIACHNIAYITKQIVDQVAANLQVSDSSFLD